MVISVERSTLYPEVAPWIVHTTGFYFPDTYWKAARKALSYLCVVYNQHL